MGERSGHDSSYHPHKRIKSPGFHIPRQVVDAHDISDSRDVIHYAHELPIKAIPTYLREAFFRKRDWADIVRGPEHGDWKQHISQAMHLVYEADKSERRSNGLWEEIQWSNRDPAKLQKSPYFRVLRRGNENSRLADHGKDHTRRVEELVEGMLLNIPELSNSVEVLKWVPSLMLAVRFHDADQLFSMQKNIDNKRLGRNEELDTKSAHDLAAAAMLLVLHRRFAVEAGMLPRDAWFACAGAAAMVMDHGNPDCIEQVVSARLPAWRENDQGEKELYHGEELEKLFDRYEIDRFTLAPSQILELLRMKKAKDSKSHAGSSYGLPASFEWEYEEELQQLATDGEPLLKDMVENPAQSVWLRKGFSLVAEMFIRADKGDMVAPPAESLLRKLATQRSFGRPFFRNMDIQRQFDSIINESGNINHDLNSDARRTLWELMHIDTMAGETIVGKSDYIRKFSQDNAIMGVLTFREIGSQIIRGDYRGIEDIYDSRVRQISRKALRKIGQLGIQIALFDLAHRGEHMEEQWVHVYRTVRKKSPELAATYARRVKALQDEKELIIGKLREKDPHETDVDASVVSFQALCDMVLDALSHQYGVTAKQLKRYKVKVQQGKYPSLPYHAYDSLGGKIRTFIEPRNNP